MEFLLGAFAAFFVWMLLRLILPFRLPDTLALAAYGGIAYGVLCIPDHRAVVALACGGGVVFLYLLASKLGGVGDPGSWNLPEVHLPQRRPARRVPGEAPRGSQIGKRLPRL